MTDDLVTDLTEEAPLSRRARREVDPPRKRRGRRILAFLLGLILLGVAAVGGFALYLTSTVKGNIKQEDLLGAGPEASSLPPAPVLPTTPGVNVLLIGSDARPGDTASRADVIVLAHLPADRKKVYLVHFPRDMYVDIPGRGKNKINASYAFGGAPLLVRTMENLVGVKIDHVAKTDFTGFVGMTDAVGGVRVYAEEGNTATGNGGVAIKQGWNDLNGEQALGFVRERYQLKEGDLSRGRRQMAWIKSIITKATSREVITNPAKIAAFTDAATKNVVVDKDFTLSLMRDYAFSLRSVRGGDVVFITAPILGFETNAAGAVDIVDFQGIADLKKNLQADTMGNYLDANVTP